MKWVFLYIFLLLLCNAQGQEIDSLEIDKANELYQKGRKYRYKHKDSVYHYYGQSYEIFKQQRDWLNAVQVLKGISFTSSYHYDLSTFRKTLNTIDSVLRSRSVYFDSLKVSKSLSSRQLIEKTTYYSKIKNYEKVRSNASKLIKELEQVPDSIRSDRDTRLLCSAYEYMAGSFKHEGEYSKSEELYKKTLRIILKNLDEDFALPTYRLLGDLYRKKGDYRLSNEYLGLGLDKELSKGTSSKNRIVKSCFAIADNHIQLRLQDSALYYLDIAKRQLLTEDPLRFQYHEMLGKIYLSVHKSHQAITEFDKAIELLTNRDADLKNIEIAQLLSLKAQGFDQVSDYTRALQNYQLALSKLATDFEYQSVAENPKISSVQNMYDYLKILVKKIGTLNKAGDSEGAIQSVQMAVQIMDELLPTFENEEDKRFLVNDFYKIFEIGLSTVFELYERSKDQSYIDMAFFLSEKSKSIILLETVLNSRAYKFSNIPEEILEKEQQLKASIVYLQNKIINQKNNEELEERLLDNKTEYSNLISQLENQYPSYYNLKHNNKVVNIDLFQNTLEEGSLAISYFMGEENTYLIWVSKGETGLKKIVQSDTLEKQISDVYRMLINPISEVTELQKSLKAIYAEIVQPVLNNGSYSSLVIIPDGRLHYIPFESLYDGRHYILENYTVGYGNSATLLTQLKENINQNRKFLGFAPSFSKEYTPLVNSETEVLNIIPYFDGEVFTGIEATSDIFKAKSASSGILHLATHAVIDDQIAENSHLVFSPDSQDEKLNISDIYALPINASLVALSACETGIGNLQKGEGMISLSRAFFYAGASSIANTKWQINDRSTVDIMNDFYKALASGKRKDQALRQSKLNFLHKNYDNNYKHPYYWSGLVITGSMTPINKETPLWLWLGIPLGLIIGSIVFLRKRYTT